MVKEIYLEKKFNKRLGLSNLASRLFDEIKDEKEVIFNFENVEFVSSSFAQEYVYQRYHSNVKVTETNMCEFVENVINGLDKLFRETCL